MAKQQFTPGTGMFYVGRRDFDFGGRTLKSGDPVPEAFGWPKARALVSLERLVWSPFPTSVDPALAAHLVSLGWTPPPGTEVAPPVELGQTLVDQQDFAAIADAKVEAIEPPPDVSPFQPGEVGEPQPDATGELVAGPEIKPPAEEPKPTWKRGGKR